MNSSAPVTLSAASDRASPGDFWRRIERFLKAEMLGPGVITLGDNDQLLYPWVTAQVASRLALDPVPPNIHELVCAHLRKNDGNVEDVCLEIDELLDSPALEPGPLLKTLASVAQCRLFFTLGFDRLMERALSLLRCAGRQTPTWCFSLDRESVDLPNPAGSRALLGC